MTEYTDENENNLCLICYDGYIKYSYQCNFHHVCNKCYWKIDKCPYCQSLRKLIIVNRSFDVKLEQNGSQYKYGQYNEPSPYQAASKVLSEIIRDRVKNNQQADEDITFYLEELTDGNGKYIHKYIGNRVKLDNPTSYVNSDGQIVIKEYKNILRKINRVENI